MQTPNVRTLKVQGFTDRHDAETIEGLDGTLRAGIEAADRFNGVADELDADRQLFAGRKNVEDAAAASELAVCIYWIRRLVTTERQGVRQHVRIDIDAGLDLTRREQNRRRLRKLREQGGRRCNNDACRIQRQRVQHPGTGGGDFQVRLEAAIWIDLRGRKRQHLPLNERGRRSFEHRQEERNVADGVVDVGVGRNDQEDGLVVVSLGGRRNRQRAYRRRRTADALEGGLQPRFPKNASQQRP